MKALFRKCCKKYTRFMEKQGFAVTIIVCVATITATALWTSNHSEAYAAPTPPPGNPVSVAQLLQESLRSAATATPAPTSDVPVYHQPLDSIEILQPFSTGQMTKGSCGLWRVHAAADYQGKSGAAVYAIADGTVTASGSDELLGLWLLIDHGDGIEALYASLSAICDYRAGDPVFTGDLLGFVGTTLLDESEIGPHLHLQITRNGEPIDPCVLMQE